MLPRKQEVITTLNLQQPFDILCECPSNARKISDQNEQTQKVGWDYTTCPQVTITLPRTSVPWSVLVQYTYIVVLGLY